MTTHRARVHLYRPVGLGGKIADRTAALLGSWPFILAQTAVVLLWIALNVLILARRFDPYPFILLNLAFSTQAAYTGPILLLAGNRQAARDRARDDLEAEEVAEILSLLHELKNPAP